VFDGEKYVTPLYRMDKDGVPELGASGVWLAVGHRRFLLTAAHAIDDGFRWFPQQQGFRKLPDFVFLSTAPQGNRNLDNIDVAIVPLGAVEIAAMHPKHQFVTLAEVAVNLDHHLGDRYEFTGFPYRGATVIHWRRLITQRYVSITDRIATLREYQVRGYSPLAHVLIRYIRRKMLRDGIQITGPEPHGMSGGGIWKIDLLTGDRKLAGIATENPSQYLVGTRIALFLEPLRTIDPTISTLIPKPTDLGVAVARIP